MPFLPGQFEMYCGNLLDLPSQMPHYGLTIVLFFIAGKTLVGYVSEAGRTTSEFLVFCEP